MLAWYFEMPTPIHMSMQKPPFWYQCLIALIQPLYRLRVWQRSHKQPDYQAEVIERFHVASMAKNTQVIWIHAVSVGETNAAQPIIEYFLKNSRAVLVTNTTRTGQARAKSLFVDQYPELFEAVFLPVDTQGLMRQFLRRYQPMLFVLIETELWPNAMALTHQANIPIVLLNARLSARSAGGYARVSHLTRLMLEQLSCIAAQDADTAQRFIDLGADKNKVVVTGSVKFDIQPPEHLLAQAEQLKQQWQLANRPVLVAASTHEPEEAEILTCFKQLLAEFPQAVLIMVPRHPERFDRVAALIEQQGFVVFRRSQQQVIEADAQVYLADSMGELWLWYTMANMAFVGGSLSNTGGHNPLEPIRVGIPVVLGEHTFNFKVIVEQLLQAQAITQVTSAAELMQIWLNWLRQPALAQQQQQNALKVMQDNQGALARQLAVLDKLLIL
ncbi:lipid IV(A) 3-deoxy-D-manno-octulosonic acid transferase [Alkanindiges sp. WGS2144]|uniref:lipid IV(A) 3-deoxy-D-manno-octulosonic acid transferase n=1 Tax=Alkanindiges sp. WGS2144 TaxID=3366808 RepID=UPI00375378F0